ncbi:MAG: Ig domain-containing protein [Blautia sp.]
MKGKSQTLKIKRIRPLGASSRVKWTSSNKKVAVVNSKGKVTAKGKGTAVIKAVSAKNKKAVARCKVTVYQKR